MVKILFAPEVTSVELDGNQLPLRDERAVNTKRKRVLRRAVEVPVGCTLTVREGGETRHVFVTASGTPVPAKD